MNYGDDTANVVKLVKYLPGDDIANAIMLKTFLPWERTISTKRPLTSYRNKKCNRATLNIFFVEKYALYVTDKGRNLVIRTGPGR